MQRVSRVTRRLLGARFFRSVGQGALAVDFSLYLHSLGWTGAAIGGVLAGGGLFGAGLALGVGFVGDRMRRKPLVQAYQLLIVACGLLSVVTAQPAVLAIMAVVAGFGRGANGAAGPFSPAEQAWLADTAEPSEMGWVYSLNMAIGFVGMGVGSVLAMLPAFWQQVLPGPLAYRPLFALTAAVSLAGWLTLASAADVYRPRPELASDAAVRGQENRQLTKLVVTNAFNGLAIGLTGPLIPYWFALKFHMGPAEIAPMMALTFVATALAALLTGILARRIGLVNSVVTMRGVGIFLLVALPLMPAYSLASAVYLLRSCFNRGSAGSRQALAIGLVREGRRALAASLNTVSFQLPQAAGPAISGWLFDLGRFSLPFYLGAGLQAAYLLLYRMAFKDAERSQADASPS